MSSSVSLEREIRDRLTRLERGQKNSPAERVWRWIMHASTPVILIVGAAVTRHEVAIASLQETQFTREDALRLHAEINREIIAQPVWLRRDMSEIKELLKDLQRRVRELEKR